MAREYRCRPSALLSLDDDPLTAFYFDRAAYHWGQRVQQAMEEANDAKTDSGKKQKLVMAQSKWLGVNKFANPAAALAKRQQQSA